jgi:hypothetical protein
MLEDLLNAYLIKLLFQCSPSKFSDVLFYSFTTIYGSDWLIKFLNKSHICIINFHFAIPEYI